MTAPRCAPSSSSCVEGAKEMEINNKKLEARLSASRQEIEELQQNLETVRTESLTDPLTTLANRKFFDVELGQAMAEAKQKNEPLSLLMTDVDNFKSIQRQVRPFDRRPGIAAGRHVGEAKRQRPGYRRTLRRRGVHGRAAEHAAATRDHDRRPNSHAVMTKELMKRSSGERLGRVTISIGVAVLRPDDTPQSLLERADACLYAAKRSGRNRVICETNRRRPDTPVRRAWHSCPRINAARRPFRQWR